MEISVVLFIVAVVALLIALLVWAEKQRQKRRKLLGEWAQKHGFSFNPAEDHGIDSRFSGFDLFRQGKNRHGWNISTGNVRGRERSVHAFDYSYQTDTTGPKGERQTVEHLLSAVVVATPLKLRSLSIRSENFFDRVVEFFGVDDIDFELDEFNRAFHVQAPDRRWAFDVLHQKAMEFMLASPRFIIEFNDGRVLIYRDSVFDVKDFDDALAVVNGLLDILPPSVVRELTDTR